MTPPSTTPRPGGTPPTAPSASSGAAGTGIASWVTRSQFAVLLACQMPLKSGFPLACRAICPAGAGAVCLAAAGPGEETCPAITARETTHSVTMMPTARAETPNRVRMMPPSRGKRAKSYIAALSTSSCTLVISSAARRVVLRRRVESLAFRKRLLRRARVQQHAEQAVIALVAAALEHERRFLVGSLEVLHR